MCDRYNFNKCPFLNKRNSVDNDSVSHEYFNLKMRMMEKEMSRIYEYLLNIIESNENEIEHLKENTRKMTKKMKSLKKKQKKTMSGNFVKTVGVSTEQDTVREPITLEVKEIEDNTTKRAKLDQLFKTTFYEQQPDKVVEEVTEEEEEVEVVEVTEEEEVAVVEEVTEEEQEVEVEVVEVTEEEEEEEEEEVTEEEVEEVTEEEVEEVTEEEEEEEEEETETEAEELEEEEVEVEEEEAEELEEEEVEVEEESEEEEEEEEEEELEEFVYKKKKYYVTDETKGDVYEYLEDESVGDKVGVIINGKIKLSTK